MKNLSAVILTKNEEKNIEEAIKSVSFAKQVLVIDDYSTDKTRQLAEKIGIKVIQHRLNNDFAKQRNFALEKCRYDWVLFIDADERISEALKNTILGLDENSNTSAYLFPRADWFWNKKLRFGETGNCFVFRLVHKKRGFFTRSVHEKWIAKKGVIKKLKQPLYHYPHPSIKEFLQTINFYSSLNANYYQQIGKKTNVFDIILTPLFKFIYTYFVKLGFLDGPAGFVYSFMMSFHSFLTRSKLYMLSDK